MGNGQLAETPSSSTHRILGKPQPTPIKVITAVIATISDRLASTSEGPLLDLKFRA